MSDGPNSREPLGKSEAGNKTQRHYVFTLWIKEVSTHPNANRQSERRLRGSIHGIRRSEWVSRLDRISRDERVRFIGGQLERSPTTGRLHVQGYIQFRAAQRGTTLISIAELTGADLYFAAARGTPQECVDYCSKEESRVEPYVSFGDLCLQQGQRTDIEECCKLLKETKDLKRLAQEFPAHYVRYSRGFQALLSQLATQDHSYEKRAVHVKWGPSDTGKTAWANSHSNDEGGFWRAPPFAEGKSWFGGDPPYRGEKTVTFQDYAGENGCLSLPTFLQVTDNWECTVEYKGGHCNFRPRRILITSNSPPSQWYPNAPRAQQPAIRRRITSSEYTGDGLPNDYCEEWDLSKEQVEEGKKAKRWLTPNYARDLPTIRQPDGSRTVNGLRVPSS